MTDTGRDDERDGSSGADPNRPDPNRPDPNRPDPGWGEPRYGQPTYGAPSYGSGSYGSGADASPPRYEQPTEGLPPRYEPPAPPHPSGPQQAPWDQPAQQQPAYDSQPGQHQPGQQHPTQQLPTQQVPPPGGPSYGPPGGYPPPAGWGGPPPPPGPGPRNRSRRTLFVVLGVVAVLVVGLGVGGWALFLRGGPAVTWQGREVTNADQTLTEASGKLTALVDSLKGTKGTDTRCYFAVRKNAPDDQRTDVSDTVYCGPALFVDGVTDKPFIPYPVAASSSGDSVTLRVDGDPQPEDAVAAPTDADLVRPDGQTPPSGAGGLKVPEPPPAEENVFVAADDLDLPAGPDGAVMASLTGGVRIDKLGEVDRYGSGTDARSAPDGQKLIGFALGDAPGDADDNGVSAMKVSVSVDGGTGQQIPDPTGTNVIAVPQDATSVDLVSSVDGVKQSLSLLTGEPGSGNLAVLARQNRYGELSPPATLDLTESGGGQSAPRPCTLSGSVSGLFYWADDSGSTPAGGAGKAFLRTDIDLRYASDSPPPFTGSSKGDPALAPEFLSLQISGGAKVPAKVVADRLVFEVPANFTEGTIVFAGSVTNANGVTFAVTRPVNVAVKIPTG